MYHKMLTIRLFCDMETNNNTLSFQIAVKPVPLSNSCYVKACIITTPRVPRQK